MKYTESTDYIGKTVKVVIERPLGSTHPKHTNTIYDVNYGHIPDTLSPDGEELDAYLLGIDKPLEWFEGVCIAVLRRTQEQDDKLIVTFKNNILSDEEIRKSVDFQEKFFNSVIIRSKA